MVKVLLTGRHLWQKQAQVGASIYYEQLGGGEEDATKICRVTVTVWFALLAIFFVVTRWTSMDRISSHTQMVQYLQFDGLRITLCGFWIKWILWGFLASSIDDKCEVVGIKIRV